MKSTVICKRLDSIAPGSYKSQLARISPIKMSMGRTEKWGKNKTDNGGRTASKNIWQLYSIGAFALPTKDISKVKGR